MKRLFSKANLFYLATGLIFTHELDGMINSEWRVLPLTSWLPEEVGRAAYVWLHVPLFGIVIALISSSNLTTRKRSRFWVSAFLVIHGLLHAGFMVHPHYEFSSLQSNLLIFGAAVCGLIFLIMDKRDRSV